MSGKAERIARLNRAFRVLLGDYETAERHRDERRLDAYRTALVVLDACATAEEGNTTEAEDDARVMARLREIARMRNVLPVKGDQAEAEAEAAP